LEADYVLGPKPCYCLRQSKAFYVPVSILDEAISAVGFDPQPIRAVFAHPISLRQKYTKDECIVVRDGFDLLKSEIELLDKGV
jgi:hypothetical protein